MGFCFSWCCYENRKPYGKKTKRWRKFMLRLKTIRKNNSKSTPHNLKYVEIFEEKNWMMMMVEKKQRSETFFKQKIWILVRFWLFFFGFLVRLDLHLSFCYWHIRTIVERVKFKIIMDRKQCKAYKQCKDVNLHQLLENHLNFDDEKKIRL